MQVPEHLLIESTSCSEFRPYASLALSGFCSFVVVSIRSFQFCGE